MLAEQVEDHKGKQRRQQRGKKISSCAIAVCHAADERSTKRTRRANQTEQAGDAASVVIGRRFEKKHQRRPKCAEGAEKDRAQRSRLSQHRLLLDKNEGRTN